MSETSTQAHGKSHTAASRRPEPQRRGPAVESMPALSPVAALQSGAGNRAASLWLTGGMPLSEDIRQEMESRFGESFEAVRIHNQPQAHASTAAMHAKAYTHGHDIVFSANRFAPQTASGKRLLAHELAHVVQQRRGGASMAGGEFHEREADAAARQAESGNGPISVQGASAPGIACAPEGEAGPPAPTPAEPAPVQYEYIAPDGNKVVLSAEEFEKARQRAIKNVRLDFDRIEGLADNGRQTQQGLLDEYHGNVESLSDVWSNPKSLIGIAVDMRAGVTKPYIGMWSAPNAAIKAGRTALDNGNLREAARMLSLAQTHYKSAEAEWNKYLDAIQEGGSKLISELEVVRDVSFAIAIAAGAAVAAPVVAAGVGGLGLTGTGAVAATTLGTGGVVAAGGAGLRGTAAAAGSYTTEGKVNMKDVTQEAKRGGKEGFVAGLTAGMGAGLGNALKIGAPGASAVTRIGGGALAGGTANATGEMANAALEGKELKDVAKAGARGFGTGTLGGAGSGLAGAVKSPAVNKLITAGVGAGTGALGTALSGGSKDDVIASAAMGGASALALGSAKAPPGAAQQKAFDAGRRVRRTVKAGTTAAMIGLAEAAPATTLPGGSPSSMVASGAKPAVTAKAGAGTFATGTAKPPSMKTATTPPGPAAKAATRTSPGGAAKPAAAAPAKASAAPDVGLADRGYRPAPGERSTGRAEWKAQQGASRWKQAVDEAFGRMDALDPADAVSVPRVKGGASNPRIGDKAVPGRPGPKMDIQDLPLRPGETPRQAAARVRTVIGTKLSDHPFLAKLWNDAKAAVLAKEPLTAQNYGDLYERTRNAFWRKARSNTPEGAQARQLLDDAGFALPSGKNQRSTAPVLDSGNTAVQKADKQISLDHIEEKAQGTGWQKALDADNLRMEFAMPNTEREIKQMRHPELREP